MSIISISGKKQSGKNTVAKIIQYLCLNAQLDKTVISNTGRTASKVHFKEFMDGRVPGLGTGGWRIKAFADKLKDIICLLTGCTREQLEDENFKNKQLDEQWWYFKYDDGEIVPFIGKHRRGTTNSVIRPTYRDLLQHIGTDLFRNQLHRNIWINATFADYKSEYDVIFESIRTNNPLPLKQPNQELLELPKWIIADMRFPNELEAVKEKGGITIRVERDTENQSNHESETALDTATFDYVVNNNATIDELINQVKSILIKQQIL